MSLFRSLLNDDDDDGGGGDDNDDDGSVSKYATGKADDVFGLVVATATTTARCATSLAAVFLRIRR